MTKFLVYSLSVVAMFSVANSRPENCGAGRLGLTYCGMNWEDYFDGSEDYGEVRRNRGGGTRGGSNDGGSYGRGGQYGAQCGKNFEGSRNGLTAGGQGYGLSGSGYDQGSDGGYSSSFPNTNQGGIISNDGTTDQGYSCTQGSNGGYSSSFPNTNQGGIISNDGTTDQGYSSTQGSNGGYSSSFLNSNQGSAFGQGDSGISSSNCPTKGQENSYFERNGDNVGGYAATGQSKGQRNAAVGPGSDYLQSSNGDYSSNFATSGQVSAFDEKIGSGYSSSGQGSSSENNIRSQKPPFAKDIVWNGDSGISSSYHPTEGQENSYFDRNSDDIGGYAATGPREGQRNAAVGQGSDYIQSSNGDYSSSFATSGQVSAFDGGSYSFSEQGSGYAGGSNADNGARESSSSRCSTCEVSTINNIGNGKLNKNELHFLKQTYK